MAKTVNASQQKPMTDGQIEEVVARLRAQLTKHRNELDSEAVQEVLGTDNLGMVLLAPFRDLVEMVSIMFIRRVKGINRSQRPQEALDATGRRQHTDQSVVDAMPRGEGENVELKFFELDYEPTPAELADEYERRGLKADPIALAKHMKDNPSFADERPVACQWDLGENGAASFAAFDRWFGERAVSVDRDGSRWSRDFRFAGVCK